MRGVGTHSAEGFRAQATTTMLVEKILARPFEDLDVPAALRLMEELDEVRWALTAVQSLAEEDNTGLLSQRFAKWRGLVDDRRARMATLYPNAPSTAQGG